MIPKYVGQYVCVVGKNMGVSACMIIQMCVPLFRVLCPPCWPLHDSKCLPPFIPSPFWPQVTPNGASLQVETCDKQNLMAHFQHPLVNKSWYGFRASFPGLPIVHFLIACSMQKRKRKACYVLSHEWWCQCRKNELEALSCSFCPECWSCKSLWDKNKNVPLQVRNKEHVCKMHSFNVGPLPPSVYQGRHWHYSCDKIYQAFPLRFKWSKSGRWEGLGTRLMDSCSHLI